VKTKTTTKQFREGVKLSPKGGDEIRWESTGHLSVRLFDASGTIAVTGRALQVAIPGERILMKRSDHLLHRQPSRVLEDRPSPTLWIGVQGHVLSVHCEFLHRPGAVERRLGRIAFAVALDPFDGAHADEINPEDQKEDLCRPLNHLLPDGGVGRVSCGVKQVVDHGLPERASWTTIKAPGS